MDTRLLRSFLAVTRTGNFSRAAAEVCVSQPALSQAIQALEKDLGCKLFVRGRKTVLTPAGERLREYGERICNLLEDARDDLQRLAGGLTGTVRPAILESLLLFLLPDVLAEFAREFPQVNFQFALKETTGIEQAVLTGDAHFGLVSRPPASRQLVEEKLAEFPHILVGPANARGSMKKLLSSLPLFLLGAWQRSIVEEKTDILTQFPDARLLNPINHVAVIRQLVARGLGLAILPAFTLGPDLRVLKTFPDMKMQVFLIRRREDTAKRSPGEIPLLPAAEHFINFLVNALSRS
jgi:DNA-binding transcriptional LysR family regulator